MSFPPFALNKNVINTLKSFDIVRVTLDRRKINDRCRSLDPQQLLLQVQTQISC